MAIDPITGYRQMLKLEIQVRKLTMALQLKEHQSEYKLQNLQIN